MLIEQIPLTDDGNQTIASPMRASVHKAATATVSYSEYERCALDVSR